METKRLLARRWAALPIVLLGAVAVAAAQAGSGQVRPLEVRTATQSEQAPDVSEPSEASTAPEPGVGQRTERNRLRPVAQGGAGLKRVFTPQGGQSPEFAAEQEQWRARLVSDDLELRERGFDDLVDRARSDDRLRLMLQEWSVDTSSPDLAWTARLALRQLDCLGPSFQRTVPGFGAAPFGGNPLGGDLFREMERLFGDPSRFGGPHGEWPFGSEWRQSIDRFLQGVGPGSLSIPRAGSSGTAQSKSYQLEVGPDGVRCEVRDCVDGREETRTYEADTYEQLLEANPELREFMGVRRGVAGAAQPDGSMRAPSEDVATPDGAVRTDILGIRFGRPEAARAAEIGLPWGRGVLVERVLPGTIASTIGLLRGDVIVDINGKLIIDGDDISAALAARQPTQELRLTVENDRSQRRELVWRPDRAVGLTPEKDARAARPESGQR